MFNIDKNHCNSLEQKLLYNIMELLTKSDVPFVLPEKNIPLPFEEVEEVKEIDIRKAKMNKIKCKHCGGIHTHSEAILCGRKHSKLKKGRGKK